MTLRQAIWKVMFLLMFLPPAPPAHPADQAVNRQVEVIAPGGTVSNDSAAQIGPTQSGPGAVGLFTPNSPGNAAAYQAQMNGNLTASPIVDGNGANLTIKVPSSTPANTQMLFTPRMQSGAQAVTQTSTPSETQSSRAPEFRAPRPTNTTSRGSMYKPSNASRQKARTPRRSNVIPHRTRVSIIDQNSNSIRSIGSMTGAITYADGDQVLFGTAGSAKVDSEKKLVTLPNGHALPVRSAAKEIHQVAEKARVRL